MVSMINHFANMSESFVNWLFQALTKVSEVEAGKLAMIL